MKFWRIKWENIFAIIAGSVLLSMIIKYIMINGFVLNTILLNLLYMALSVLVIRWSAKMTRKFYLIK